MNYVITGTVIKGDGYGKKLGFPTVNLDTLALGSAQAGVYAGSAILDDKVYRAGIVIAPNKKIDSHLIGFAGDAYGKEVTLEVQKFLRDYKKFDTEAELIEQIKKDIKECSQE